MNTGIGDAVNLAWKLQAVLSRQAPEALLDTFETERRAFAIRLVRTTDRAFKFVAADGRLAQIVRTRLAPVVLPQIVKFDAVRRFMFRTLSQIALNYRDMGLAQGHAGHVHGGERLPWVKTRGFDNSDALKHMEWQVHVYGTAQAQLRKWCQERSISLRVYAWDDACDAAGLEQDAIYLVRPDTYVALAASEQDPATLDRYFDKVRIKPWAHDRPIAPAEKVQA
jgi:hypothetical protein